MPGSLDYIVAGKITEWLSVIPESKINCSPKQIVDNLRNISLDHDEVVTSFDVTYLHTNVPVKEEIFEGSEKLNSGKVAMPIVDKETFIILAGSRSSHRRWSMKKGVLENFAKFTEKHLCQISFLINLQASGLKVLNTWV